jgi:hypothetical protein
MLARLGSLQTVAATIQQQEGYYPGSLAYRNNNPGNLMYAGQAGATGTPGTLAVFDSYADGYNALLNQITLDANKGWSIQQFTSSYAPTGCGTACNGNNPTAYAQTIANNEGLSINDPLSLAIQGTSGSNINSTDTTNTNASTDTISSGLTIDDTINDILSGNISTDDTTNLAIMFGVLILGGMLVKNL